MPPTDSRDIKDPRPGLVKKKHSAEQEQWDLVKTFVKSDDFDRARQILTELTDHPNPFKQRATKMLQKIDK
jgi:hypothetical protein